MNLLYSLNICNTGKHHWNEIADCQFHSQCDFNSDRETIRKQKKSRDQGLQTVAENRQRNCKEYGGNMSKLTTK